MTVAVTSGTMPSAPRTLEETGLPVEMVYSLVAKTLHVGGAQTGMELAARLGVTFAVFEPCASRPSSATGTWRLPAVRSRPSRTRTG